MGVRCEPEVKDNEVSILAPAKVNLHLGVGAIREDGYHEVDTIMVTTGLCDRIVVKQALSLRLSMSGDIDVPAGPDNLCFRAAYELLALAGKRCSYGAYITVDKQIPIGAGLGGGSADAAATMIALNELWQLGLGVDELMSAAARIGADVPFCINGGIGRGTGTGTNIDHIGADGPWWFVICVPEVGVDTASAYRWLDEDEAISTNIDSSELVQKLGSKEYDVKGYIRNDFIDSVCKRLPQIAGLMDEVRKTGLTTTLSGSGSAVVGITSDATKAADALQQLAGQVGFIRVVPVARSRQEKQTGSANK